MSSRQVDLQGPRQFHQHRHARCPVIGPDHRARPEVRIRIFIRKQARIEVGAQQQIGAGPLPGKQVFAAITVRQGKRVGVHLPVQSFQVLPDQDPGAAVGQGARRARPQVDLGLHVCQGPFAVEGRWPVHGMGEVSPSQVPPVAEATQDQNPEQQFGAAHLPSFKEFLHGGGEAAVQERVRNSTRIGVPMKGCCSRIAFSM